MTEQHRNLLIRLKTARIEKGLSYQRIVDLCESSGESVSLATVKRVFAQGSEEQSFRYDSTLRPIARAILGLDEEPAPISEMPADDHARELFADNAAMRTILHIKDEQIADLRAQVSELKRSVKAYRLSTIILAALIFAVLLIDVMFGNVGWFRY